MADLKMPLAGWTGQQFLEFKRLYDSGVSDRDIADKIGKSMSSVKHLRMRSKLPVNKVQFKRPVSQQAAETIKSMFGSGSSDTEISKIVGLPNHTIMAFRHRTGLINAKPERVYLGFTEKLARESDFDEARLNKFFALMQHVDEVAAQADDELLEALSAVLTRARQISDAGVL